MFDSRLPWSPPSTKWRNLRLRHPPVGLDNLNGQRKLDACNAHLFSCSKSKCYVSTYLLEVGANSDDLVDKILDGEDIVLAKRLLDDLVVGEGYTLFVDLAVAALVN